MTWETVIRYAVAMVLSVLWSLWCFQRGQRSASANIRAAAERELKKAYWDGHAAGMADIARGLCASELPALREVGEFMVREGWVK